MFTISKELDTRDLKPPQPVLRTLRAMHDLETGQVLKLTTTEANAVRNMESLCREAGLVLMQYMDWDGEYTFFIRKHHRRIDMATSEHATDNAASEIDPADWQRPCAHFD